MKIAYVSRLDSRDVHQWSGISTHMTRALETHGAIVDQIGPLETPQFLLRRARRYYSRRVRGCTYDIIREPSVARAYARQARPWLESSGADVVMGSDVPSIAALQDDRPMVLWTGATYAALIDYYDDYTNLCPRSVRTGIELERAALGRCARAIYASQWAADSAAEAYGIDRSKLRVVPFGANVETGVEPLAVDEVVDRRLAGGVCRLLFIGVDWRRKGGDLAVAATERLRQGGIEAVLTVLGCDPEISEPMPDWIRPLGYISKRTVEGQVAVARELRDATVLLVPTRAENYGVAFCEASAYALPSVSTVTGGVPTIIRDGVNGQLFGLEEGADVYAAYISELVGNPTRYRELCRSARAEFDARLNWSRAGAAALEVCREAVEAGAGAV